MKTNITLQSPDRNLFGINIRQQTKTGFLNLSDLQTAYSSVRVRNGWNEKEISHIMNSKENIERIYHILHERDFIKPPIHGFMENVDKMGLTKYLKQLGVYKTTGARGTKTTWCDPYIWTLVAMELNPLLYVKVVIWLSDKLLLNRIEAGNLYKGLSRAVGRFRNVDYVKLAKAFNYRVFGRHETGIRNFGTKEQLKNIYEIESKLAFACDMGFVKSFDECVDTITKIAI